MYYFKALRPQNNLKFMSRYLQHR